MAEARTKAGTDVDKLEADFEADAGNFVPLARAYLERQLPQQAVRVCKKGLSRNPGAAEGLLALAMSYYHSYDDRNAEKTLKEFLRGAPDSAAAHRTLGEILLERHQDQKAVQELMRALELEPRDTHTRALLVSLNEKVPALQAPNGQPKESWLPRQAVMPREARRPLWHVVVQVVVLAALVVAGLIWYRHHVDIRMQVRDHLKKANAAIPRDNYTDLLTAEKELDAVMALNDSEEKGVVRQAFVRSLLWQDHAQADRKDKLKKALEWMEKEDIPNPERYGLKGFMLVDEGKPEEAAKYLDEVVKRAIEKKDIFLSAMIFGVRGTARLKLGHTKNAGEDYSRAARFSGDSPHYQALFAEVAVREGNMGRAIKYFQDALRQNPAHLYSNLRLAYVYTQVGKGLDQAKKIIDEYSDAAKHPESEFSPPLRGALFLDQAEFALAIGDLPNAGTALAKSIQAYETNAEAHDLGGRLATINQDGTKAASEFSRALALDALLPRIYFDRSESLFLLGQKSEAVDKLREFERHMKPTVPYYVKLGNLYMRMDDLEKAMPEFQKAVKVDELSPDARYHVALCFQKMGERLGTSKEKLEEKRNLYNQARAEYENTLILPGGERPEVYRMMGLIYLDAEDFDNAIDKLAKGAIMMQQAGEPGAKIAEIYLELAKVFKTMGGTEGEKQEKIYLMKAEGLKQGKTMDQVEKEAAEKDKEKGKGGGRHHR